MPATEENRRPTFNHKEHPFWAAEKVSALVRANRGAALVLSPTRGPVSFTPSTCAGFFRACRSWTSGV